MASANKLSAEAVLILTSLAGGPKHGYGIQQDIQTLSGRRIGPGSLYGSIARLEAAGLIVAGPSEGARRPYSLTVSGKSALALVVGALERVTGIAKRRLATH